MLQLRKSSDKFSKHYLQKLIYIHSTEIVKECLPFGNQHWLAVEFAELKAAIYVMFLRHSQPRNFYLFHYHLKTSAQPASFSASVEDSDPRSFPAMGCLTWCHIEEQNQLLLARNCLSVQPSDASECCEQCDGGLRISFAASEAEGNRKAAICTTAKFRPKVQEEINRKRKVST